MPAQGTVPTARTLIGVALASARASATAGVACGYTVGLAAGGSAPQRPDRHAATDGSAWRSCVRRACDERPLPDALARHDHR